MKIPSAVEVSALFTFYKVSLQVLPLQFFHTPEQTLPSEPVGQNFGELEVLRLGQPGGQRKSVILPKCKICCLSLRWALKMSSNNRRY